jgi:hypothetical protein
MLYWICPECGHECSPAIRECPTCTAPPAPERSGVSQELLSLAKSFQSTPSAGLLTAAPQRQLLVAAQEAAVAVQEPELSDKLAPLGWLAVKPARPERCEPVQLSLSPIPARISSPAVAPSAETPRAEFCLETAGPAPIGEISFHSARGGRRSAPKQPVELLPSRLQAVAFVRAEMPGADHSGLAVADLTQLAAARLTPVVSRQNGQPKPEALSTPLDYSPSAPAFVSSQVELAGESLAELLNALKISEEELEQAAIQVIRASFHDRPAMSLLSAPPEIVRAPAPPAEQWMRAPSPKFTASAPDNGVRGSGIAGPQAPTLAGPSLPPQLRNFIAHQNSVLRPHRKRVTAPTWIVVSLVVALVTLGGRSLLQNWTSDRDSKPVSAAVAQPQISQPAPEPSVPIVQEHPAARSVEVAGVRIVTGPNKKPQLQYIVINHSASELTGLNVRIAVRSVDALAGAPLFSISSVVASLGPNQSKEIRTDLDSSVKPSAIPDWQSLRTEVLIARQ